MATLTIKSRTVRLLPAGDGAYGVPDGLAAKAGDRVTLRDDAGRHKTLVFMRSAVIRCVKMVSARGAVVVDTDKGNMYFGCE